MGIAQRTIAHRETAAADAGGQLVAQCGQLGDALVQIRLPVFRQVAAQSLAKSWRSSGSAAERLLDIGERDAGALGDLDDGDAAQHAAGIAALVAAAAHAPDQALGLVKMQRRDRDAAAGRDLADTQFAARQIGFAFFHGMY